MTTNWGKYSTIKLNISNKENITCDSGYIFQAILAEEFNKNGHEYIGAGSDFKQFRKAKFHTQKRSIYH